MRAKIVTLLKRALVLIIVAMLTLLGVRAYNVLGGPPLQLWHTFLPEELSVSATDQVDWKQYLAHEDKLMADIRREVTEKLPPSERVQINRYFEGSLVYPPSFAENWNRSYIMNGIEKPVGAVVFLHGLTDSPFSLRHIARSYNAHGFISIGIRLPGHGTVPSGLSSVEWEEWMAATRLAVREAKALTSPEAPLHLVGFSNGGALALKYALDALENSNLARPDRLVLLSPMIGITRFARFAGFAAWPAVLPVFAKSAWLGIVPEFNPFKFNSFPVNGARQSHRLTMALQEQILRLAQSGQLNEIAPVLTFQSIIDYTVSTPAVISALYAHLPANGSELVLFDVNRATPLGPLMRSAFGNALNRVIPDLPQRYAITVIANATPAELNMVERVIPAGETAETVRALDLSYPLQIFSLSHVALPFPMNDPLYGLTPDPGTETEFGVSLGTITARGERGALVVNLDSLFRIASNPFFPYLLERVEEGMRQPFPLPPASVDPGKVYGDPVPHVDPEEYWRITEGYTEEYSGDTGL